MYKLSICIITRNRVNHVRSLLDNLALTLKDYSCPVEVVLLDNASSECLIPEEVTRYQHLFDFRIIYHDSNIGVARNYLAALSNSAGEWCWVLGDDDIYNFSGILDIFSLVNCNCVHDDFIRTSLIHINHSQFVEDGDKHFVLKERVHSIDSDALLSEADFLGLFVGSIGSLLFVSSNILKMTHLRSRLKANYLHAYANNCVCLSVPLIAIHRCRAFVISEPLIKDRLGGSWSGDKTQEHVFRLELPCSIFASQNPTAIKTLAIKNSRLRSFAKTVIVGIVTKDLTKTIFFISQFLWFRFRFSFLGAKI
jgi:glycosyltransferase involved in cell wall biosynthesis